MIIITLIKHYYNDLKLIAIICTYFKYGIKITKMLCSSNYEGGGKNRKKILCPDIIIILLKFAVNDGCFVKYNKI